jgi:predicted PurR-regulated permease PerM
VVLGIGACFWLLYRFNIVLTCLVSAVILSMAIEPAVEWLHRRGLSRGTGVGLIYLGLLGTGMAVLVLVAPLLVEQGSRLAGGLTGTYSSAQALLEDSPSRFVRQLAWQLPARLPALSSMSSVQPAPELVSQVTKSLSLAANGIFTGVAVLLLAYYWTLDQERAVRSLLLLAPAERREGIREFSDIARAKVGQYVRGITILCLIVGTLSFLAYALIGLPDALMLGILAGLFEAIPLIGPVLGALPAVLIALSVDPSKVVWVIAAAAAIQVLENTFLVPRVMKRAVGVHPFVSLLALAAFGSLFGVPGALLAIPLAAVLQLIVARMLGSPPSAQSPEGRGPLTVLQVETQHLVQDLRKQIRGASSPPGREVDDIEDSLEAAAVELHSLLGGMAAEEQAP